MITSWTCVDNASGTDCTVTGSATSTVQGSVKSYDSGDLVFGNAIIIFMFTIVFVGFVYNSFTAKK